jgi:proline racemase
MISWSVIIRCSPIGNISNFAKFLAPCTERTQIYAGRNAVIIQPEKIECAPSGTGVSAHMAVLHAKG